MTWNWQQAEWPKFSYDKKALEPLESEFLLRAGELRGVLRHLGSDDRDQIRLDLISEEALKTSAIEGEISIARACNHRCASSLACAAKPGVYLLLSATSSK